MAGLYAQKYSPARAPSPHHHHHHHHLLRTNNNNNNIISLSTPQSSLSDVVDSEYLLSELLGEHQKLAPFTQVLPICSRLLNQEILRVSGNMVTNQQQQQQQQQQDRMHSPGHMLIPSGGGADEDIINNFRGPRPPPPPQDHQQEGIIDIVMDWQPPPNNSNNISKKILRLDIPPLQQDTYPSSSSSSSSSSLNFVGRLLGPRGNSLKRVEACTGCRVFIRGKGSIKDAAKEESLRGRPGYEHLNQPLHILIEAHLPLSILDLRLRQAKQIIQQLMLKPVEESQDFYKRQQLRELVMLNSNIREQSPQPQPQPQPRTSVSPFSSSGMKRAKTGQ